MCNSEIAKIAGIAKIAEIHGILAVLAFLAIPAAAQRLPEPPLRSLEPLIGAPRPGIQPVTSPRPAAAGLDDPRTLSLSITQPTPLRTVLQLLFRGTAVSAVVPASLTGTFSGELRNVTLRQALDAVVSHSGCGYAVRGTVIHVFPRIHAQEGRR